MWFAVLIIVFIIAVLHDWKDKGKIVTGLLHDGVFKSSRMVWAFKLSWLFWFLGEQTLSLLLDFTQNALFQLNFWKSNFWILYEQSSSASTLPFAIPEYISSINY